MADIKICKAAIDLMVQEEVGAEYPGDTRYYNKFLIHPTWPGGDSGVTIGIGYDLGYASVTQIKADWGDKVNGNHLVQLISAAGFKGQMAKKQIGPLMRQVTIPYDVALQVFISRSIPAAYKQALEVYPGLDKLNADTIGAIVSLVYNRGNKLTGPNREGMAALVPLIAKADYMGIAQTIEGMKHIWEGGTKSDDGLVDRRVLEANLVRKSISDIATNDDQYVSIAA